MANFNFNKVILAGRITRDIELRSTSQDIPVTTFSIAVNRPQRSADSQQKADFFNCTAWRHTAEFVSKYFRKGSSICVTGSLQNREWTDQQGNKRTSTEIVVDEVNFVDSKAEADARPASTGTMPPAYDSSQQNTAFSSDPVTSPEFEEVSSDDDLPF